MRKVTAVSKVKSEECIAWLKYCQQHCSVGLCTRVRLHICILCTKEFLNALDGKILYFVHNLTTTIIAFARIAFGILVGKV